MATDEGLGAPGEGVGLQFDKVELPSPEAGRACARCQRGIADEYFEIGGNMLCRACATELGGGQGGAGAFLRALGFGGAVALVCTIAWYLIVKLWNYELGLIAVGVGLAIGIAVRKGSRGRGGWKYQLLAMLLTYGSITVSKIPFIVDGIRQAADAKGDSATAPPQGGSATLDETKPDSEKAAAPAGAANQVAAKPKAPPSAGELVLAFAFLIGIALASPFLMGTENIIGILIIGIALYEAWKINRRAPVAGPFRLGPPAAAPVPPPGPVPMSSP